jgi:hypothetical protein
MNQCADGIQNIIARACQCFMGDHSVARGEIIRGIFAIFDNI